MEVNVGPALQEVSDRHELEASMRRHAMTCVVGGMALIVSGEAKWLKSPTPGIPRTPDGKPDLSAPAPRTADGKPDLSGVWQMRLEMAYQANLLADLSPTEIMPW